MATISITGTTAAGSVTASATLADAGFAAILVAFAEPLNAGLPPGAPKLTDQQVFAAIFKQFISMVAEQATSYAQQQAAAAASASVTPIAIS